jgi:NFU1 iron-sulfur cluster scaffold homolog, mitochondrial
MSSTGVMHVERTDDPLVLRWVTHNFGLIGSANGERVVAPTSALASLVDEGSVHSVEVVNGDVLVTFAHPHAVSASASVVRGELMTALSSRASWLFDGSATATSVPVTKESVEAIIDAAVGPLLAAHGGSIEVVAVDDACASVRMHGACRGCSGVDSTLHGLVRSALMRAHPGLVDVVEIGSNEPSGRRLSSLVSGLMPTRRRS